MLASSFSREKNSASPIRDASACIEAASAETSVTAESASLSSRPSMKNTPRSAGNVSLGKLHESGKEKDGPL